MQEPVSRHQSDASGIPTQPNIPLGGERKGPGKREGAARLVLVSQFRDLSEECSPSKSSRAFNAT